MRRFIYELMLVMAALIWGNAFVAQSVAMRYMGPWFFNAVRYLIGSFFLLAVIPLLDRIRGKETVQKADGNLLKGGIMCGICVAAASAFQQIGLVYTTPGKAGFLTALYIVIVPVLLFFTGKKTGKNVWIAVVMSLAGLYFLSMAETLSISKGDLLEVCGAFLFSLQILCVAGYAKITDSVRLNCLQFLTAGIISIIPGLMLENPSFAAVKAAAVPILYAGIFSVAVAYTLQIVGQKHIHPAVASILMSLESVFAVIGGFLILHQALTPKELLGCALIFAAVLTAQKEEKNTAGTL